MSGRPGAWAIAALLAPALVAAQAPPFFIGTFETEAAPGIDPAGAVAVTLRLHPQGAARAKSLRRWLPAARVAGDRADFRLRGYPVPSDRPRAAQRAASFYVDFDEPSVQALRPAIEGLYGRRPSADDLARFVDDRIARKSTSRIFDPASVTATRMEGDCSEHAVLLAAVARLFRQPSRVVHGLAVLELEGRWTSFGHAWTEIHDGRRWRLVDATHPPGRVIYLPLGVLEDEGPGSGVAARGSLTPIDVAGVALAPAGN